MQSIRNFIRERPDLLIALGAILVTIVTFGALIPELGYYQDDWYQVWAAQTRGPASLIGLFAGDRPFMGYIFAVEFQVLGNNLLAWHLFALALKVAGVLGVWVLCRQIWPQQRWATICILLIFAVYPGFLSQPIANTFQNHLVTYAAAIWSIVAGVAAIQTVGGKRWALALLSLILTAFYLPIYEYMIGLEAVKIVFLGLAIHKDSDASFSRTRRKTILWYLPHAILAALFVFWRFFLFESTRPTTDQARLFANLAASPLRSLGYLIIDTGKDLIDTVVHVWSVPSYRLYASALYREVGEALLWALPVMAITVFLLRAIARKDRSADHDRGDLLFLGAWAVLVALLPISFSGREVLFNGFERYTLQASLGVSLLLAGVLSYVRPRMRAAILIGLVFIGVTTHILNARGWADTWAKQRDLYWQVAWRVPAFKDDTLVIVSNFAIEQDYEAWVPLNLIYAPQAPEPVIDAEIMYSGAVADIQAGNPVSGSGRIAHTKDFSLVVIFSQPTEHSCLHVIDGNLPILSPFEDPLVANVAAYSSLEHIESSASPSSRPPGSIFGQEPDHDWCYYYQKISLARQSYDWTAILDLAAMAEAQGLRPSDPSEWMPVYEALINSGDLDAARQPASILRSNSDLKIPACTTLIANKTYLQALPDYDYDKVLEILCTEWE